MNRVSANAARQSDAQRRAAATTAAWLRDQLRDLSALRAQRHADTDLAHPLRHVEGEDAVHADQRQARRRWCRRSPSATRTNVRRRLSPASRCSIVAVLYTGMSGSNCCSASRSDGSNWSASPCVRATTLRLMMASLRRKRRVDDRQVRLLLVQVFDLRITDHANHGHPRAPSGRRTSRACRSRPGPARCAAQMIG